MEQARLKIIKNLKAEPFLQCESYQSWCKKCPVTVHDLKLKHTWAAQEDNDPKHSSRFTSDRLKTKEGFGAAQAKSGLKSNLMLEHHL